MNLFDRLAAAFGTTVKSVEDKAHDAVQHQSWNSMRTIMVVLFIGYVLYLSHLVLTPDNLKLTAVMIGLLVICNTLTKLGSIAANAWIAVAAKKYGKPEGAAPVESDN